MTGTFTFTHHFYDKGDQPASAATPVLSGSPRTVRDTVTGKTYGPPPRIAFDEEGYLCPADREGNVAGPPGVELICGVRYTYRSAPPGVFDEVTFTAPSPDAVLDYSFILTEEPAPDPSSWDILTQSVAAEATARATGDSDTLDAAKAYTDDQVAGGVGSGGQSGPFELAYTNSNASGTITLPDPTTATWLDYTLTGNVTFAPPDLGTDIDGKAVSYTIVTRQVDDGVGPFDRTVNFTDDFEFTGTQVSAQAGAGAKTIYTVGRDDSDPVWKAAGTEVEVGANRVVTLTDAATVTIDASLGDIFRLTFTSAVGTTRALAVPINMVDGQMIEIQLLQDGAGGKTVTLPGWGFGDDLPSPLNLSAGANKMDLALAQYVGPLGKPLLIDLRRGF